MPVLRDPTICCQQPICIIANSLDSRTCFNPVVGEIDSNMMIPLCDVNLLDLPVKYCLKESWLKASPEERESRKHELLYSYLKIEHIVVDSNHIPVIICNENKQEETGVESVYQQQITELEKERSELIAREKSLEDQLKSIRVITLLNYCINIKDQISKCSVKIDSLTLNINPPRYV